jgi:hypothetical protein
MMGIVGYGGSDSEDDDAPVSSATETETEDEPTPRGKSGPTPASLAGATAAAAAPKVAAVATTAAAAPLPGVRIVVKPAPAVRLGDDPDGERVCGAAVRGGGGVTAAASAEELPPPPPLEELCERFLGPEVPQPPPSDQGELQALQDKVIHHLQRYHKGGQHFVDYMRTSHAFRNPEILTKLVGACGTLSDFFPGCTDAGWLLCTGALGVKQYGSNFDPAAFDPEGYVETEDSIDAVFEQQHAWLRKRDAAHAQRGTIEFVPSASESRLLGLPPAQAAAAAAAAAAVAQPPASKRSKWGARVDGAGSAGAPATAPAPASTGNPYADFVKHKQMAAAAAARQTAAVGSGLDAQEAQLKEKLLQSMASKDRR